MIRLADVLHAILNQALFICLSVSCVELGEGGALVVYQQTVPLLSSLRFPFFPLSFFPFIFILGLCVCDE